MQPRIVYVVTEDWYFWSHRLDLARQARDAGYAVAVATRTTAHRERMAAEGFEIVEMPFERSLRHPARDVAAVFALASALRRLGPDVVHLVSLKPMLLAGLAILFMRRTRFVHAVTGMGYLFSSSDRRARGIQRILVTALRVILARRNCHVIAQNADDCALLESHGLGSAARRTLIAGSGVDVARYAPTPLPAEDVVVLPARLIRDKGIEEFVAAARLLRARGVAARLALVGGTDPDNPAAIPEREVEAWVDEGAIEWWGQREDMPAVYAEASIVCLPSYREGLPKVLLEAAACARPLVSTDVPGCREICRPGVSGVLVPARDAAALASALAGLIADPARRATLGAGGRALVELEFSSARIAAETLALYARLRGAA
ncbi:MAG: glycosyltransferase family 4 protein [Gammaproteobacteria bacterium]|nr:glycosyltransferase family 4 protein [Gammaproteobacteria bacterium]